MIDKYLAKVKPLRKVRRFCRTCVLAVAMFGHDHCRRCHDARAYLRKHRPAKYAELLARERAV